MKVTSTVYNNPERKRELLEGLKEAQDFQLKASESLDNKAWSILSVTSATFGIVSAIQVSLITNKTPPLFWIGIVLILMFYAIQVYHVLRAIRPMKWYVVPGAGDDTRYETIMSKFVAANGEQISEDDYLNQLIADYTGNLDIHDRKTVVSGSIQKIEANNLDKASHIQVSALLLGIIVAALIGLSFAVSLGRLS